MKKELKTLISYVYHNYRGCLIRRLGENRFLAMNEEFTTMEAAKKKIDDSYNNILNSIKK